MATKPKRVITPPDLYPEQIPHADKLSSIINQGASVCLISPTGTGKTYMLGEVLNRWFKDGKATKDKPFPVLFITKPTIVNQTREVLLGQFGLDKVLVLSYSQLRSQLGDMWLRWQKTGKIKQRYKILQVKDKQGNVIQEQPYFEDYEEEIPYWKEELGLLPDLMVCDEWQAVKNEDSLQTSIIESYITKSSGQILMSSATPFATVQEARLTCLAIAPYVVIDPFDHSNIKTNPDTFFPSDHKTRLNENLWSTFATEVSGGTQPNEYNHEAIGRLRKILASNLVVVENIRFKKRTITHTKSVTFKTDADKAQYTKVLEQYYDRLSKINRESPGGIMQIWVETQKYRQGAELIKAGYLADEAFDLATNEGKCVIVGFVFVASLERCKLRLSQWGVPLEQISVIVGGQKPEIRDQEVKKFQTGKTTYCLLTSGSGGEGISLHHNDKNAKVTKPRACLIPLPWSAIQFVQLLGRGHRINSVSTTYQWAVAFADTVEEDVAKKLEIKIRSLKEIVSKRETWTELFTQGNVKDNEIKDKQLTTDNQEDMIEDAGMFENPVDESEVEKEEQLAN